MATIGDADAKPLLAVFGHIDEIGLVITHVDEKGYLYFQGDRRLGRADPRRPAGRGPDSRRRRARRRRPQADPRARARRPQEGGRAQGPSHRHRRRRPRPRARPRADRRLRRDRGAIRHRSPTAASSRARWTTGSAPTSRSSRCAVSTSAASSRHGCARSPRSRRRSACSAPGRARSRSSPTSRSRSTSPTPPTPPASTRRSSAAIRSAPGPSIGRGATLSPQVFELLCSTAEAAGIEYTIEAHGRYTGTDAGAVHISRSGVPTGDIGVPLRYMHSPVEMVDLADLEAVVELVVAFAEALDDSVDFSR